MTTTGYAQRARSYLQPNPPDVVRTGNEINERNEVIPHRPVDVELAAPTDQMAKPTVPDPIPANVTSLRPLDLQIIEDIAKWPKEKVLQCLDRTRQTAAQPGATPLHHQLVRDWDAIARHKERDGAGHV